MIHQIFYISSAVDKLINEDEISNIIQKAQITNAKLDITGLLLFKKGIFIQLLEGPKESVQSLFQKIEKDTRHSNIIKFLELDENERIFPDWSMGLKELGDLDFKLVNEMLSWNKMIPDQGKIDNSVILEMMKRFREK